MRIYKKSRLIAAAFTAAAVAVKAVPVSAGTKTHTMDINPDKAVSYASEYLYGIGAEWNNGYVDTAITGSPSVSAEARQLVIEALKGSKFPLYRQAGVTSSYFRWKDSIGPVEERPSYSIMNVLNYRVFGEQRVHYTIPGGLQAGLVEWLEQGVGINENCRFAIVVNMLNDSIENISDFVRFMSLEVDDPKAIGTDGINWAQKRADYGFKEPFKDVVWCLGNELEQTKTGSGSVFTLDYYVSESKKYIDVIREVEPDALIAALASTGVTANREDRYEMHRYVLRELGDRIDYLDVHSYYGNGVMADGLIRCLEQIKKDIKEITGSDHIRVFISEYGMSESGSVPNKHAMQGACYTAEMFNRGLSIDIMELAAMFSFSGYNFQKESEQWAYCYRENDGTYGRTAVGDVLDLYATYGVGNVLDTEISDYGRTTNGSFAATAIKDSGGNINVLMSNATDTDEVQLDIGLEGYSAKKTIEIKGASLSSSNTTGRHEVNTTETECDAAQKSFIVPKACVKVIVFEKNAE